MGFGSDVGRAWMHGPKFVLNQNLEFRILGPWVWIFSLLSDRVKTGFLGFMHSKLRVLGFIRSQLRISGFFYRDHRNCIAHRIAMTWGGFCVWRILLEGFYAYARYDMRGVLRLLYITWEGYCVWWVCQERGWWAPSPPRDPTTARVCMLWLRIIPSVYATNCNHRGR